MPIKLGELLVKNGVITRHQLQEALHAQTIFGGRLGTNLVELGYVNEADLSKLLSAQLNVPYATFEDLEDLDRELLKLVPTAVVRKHKVIPLSLEGRTLRLAMPDPTRFPVIDEVCFATGLRIEPVVAPEVMLVAAAEKYYDVPRDVRYIRAAGMAQNLSDTSTTASSMRARLHDEGELVIESGGEDRSNEERAVDGFPIHQAVIELVRARKTSDILDVIRTFVSEDFQRMAVFVFRGDLAVGATLQGCKLTREEFQEFNFPIESSALMSKAYSTKESFFGVPEGISGVDDWVFAELGLPRQRPTLLMPILSKGEIRCAVLACENKKGEILDMQDSYNLLGTKLGLAFELVDLSDRILDLS
ncbi:MAG: hypothetical protein JXR96_03345 [Deltaproteobacteria bacterium]|nr:hypothetical protein [Deltaproteobacteria bacterium]